MLELTHRVRRQDSRNLGTIFSLMIIIPVFLGSSFNANVTWIVCGARALRIIASLRMRRENFNASRGEKVVKGDAGDATPPSLRSMIQFRKMALFPSRNGMDRMGGREWNTASLRYCQISLNVSLGVFFRTLDYSGRMQLPAFKRQIPPTVSQQFLTNTLFWPRDAVADPETFQEIVV